MTAQEKKIIDAACEWWLSLAPKDYPEVAHFVNSALNTRSEKEAMLAHFISKYLQKRNDREIHPIVEKEALDGLQTEVGSWSDITFPNSTLKTMMKHLWKEVQELQDEMEADEIFPNGKSGMPHEIADCIMLLFHMAHRIKTSSRDAIREKFEICKKRKWGPPDKDGCVHHVKEEHEDHR